LTRYAIFFSKNLRASSQNAGKDLLVSTLAIGIIAALGCSFSAGLLAPPVSLVVIGSFLVISSLAIITIITRSIIQQSKETRQARQIETNKLAAEEKELQIKNITERLANPDLDGKIKKNDLQERLNLLIADPKEVIIAIKNHNIPIDLLRDEIKENPEVIKASMVADAKNFFNQSSKTYRDRNFWEQYVPEFMLTFDKDNPKHVPKLRDPFVRKNPQILLNACESLIKEKKLSNQEALVKILAFLSARVIYNDGLFESKGGISEIELENLNKALDFVLDLLKKCNEDPQNIEFNNKICTGFSDLFYRMVAYKDLHEKQIKPLFAKVAEVLKEIDHSLEGEEREDFIHFIE